MICALAFTLRYSVGCCPVCSVDMLEGIGPCQIDPLFRATAFNADAIGGVLRRGSQEGAAVDLECGRLRAVLIEVDVGYTAVCSKSTPSMELLP